MTAKNPLLCATCRKPIEATNEDFPFCSDRCRIIDLGKWASGDYKISTPIFDPEGMEELDRALQQLESNPNPHTESHKWKN